jgi:predicted DNA-binding transcriptional regulator AlpA
MPAMSKPDVVSTPLPEYLTAQQIARFLRCTPQTVRNWCKRGLLPPPLALGRRKRLWDAAAVRTALDRLKGPAAAAEGGKRSPTNNFI